MTRDERAIWWSATSRATENRIVLESCQCHPRPHTVMGMCFRWWNGNIDRQSQQVLLHFPINKSIGIYIPYLLYFDCFLFCRFSLSDTIGWHRNEKRKKWRRLNNGFLRFFLLFISIDNLASRQISDRRSRVCVCAIKQTQAKISGGFVIDKSMKLALVKIQWFHFVFVDGCNFRSRLDYWLAGR